MKPVELSEAVVIAEYQAVRAEILLRLQFQQQLLYYSLLGVGLIAPIVGLFALSAINPQGVLTLLLLGSIASTLLQLIYIKQYVYVQQLSYYIANKLGVAYSLDESSPRDEIPVFSGWERHLNSKLIKPHLVDLAIAITGAAESTFPLIGGILYLITYIASISQVSQLKALPLITFTVWAVFDATLIFIALLVSFAVRGWGRDLRVNKQESLKK